MRDDEFERLYRDHARGLLAFLAYRVGDRALAEDLVADTFERVLRGRRRFDPRRGREKTWLYAIALNRTRDVMRRRDAEARALRRTPDEGAPSAGTEWVDERDELMRALLALSEEEREAVALRYGADLTLPEIAKLTKEKLTTVEGRVYRALRKLRQELD